MKMIILILTACLLLPHITLAQPWYPRLWERPDGPPPEWANPPFCPKCWKANVVYVSYGLPPADNPELTQAIKDHKVELGGCAITPDSRKWKCRDCGHRWGELKIFEPGTGGIIRLEDGEPK